MELLPLAQATVQSRKPRQHFTKGSEFGISKPGCLSLFGTVGALSAARILRRSGHRPRGARTLRTRLSNSGGLKVALNLRIWSKNQMGDRRDFANRKLC